MKRLQQSTYVVCVGCSEYDEMLRCMRTLQLALYARVVLGRRNIAVEGCNLRYFHVYFSVFRKIEV